MDYYRDRVNRLISRNTKILIGFFILTFIAAVLQTVGYVTPGWLVFSGTSDQNVTFKMEIGLWYQRACTDSCEIGHIASSLFWSKEDKKDFDTLRLVGLMAVVFSIVIPIVVLVNVRRTRLQQDTSSIAGFVLISCLGSGVTALVVVGLTANDVQVAYDLWLKTEDTDFKLGILYSLSMMGLGGALDCLAFIGLCVFLYFRKKTCGDNESGEDFVGMM